MKKLLALALAAITLTACGSGSKEVTKTCSYEESGIKASVTATAPAEDKNVTKMKMNVEAPYDAMKITADDLSDDDKEAFSDYLSSIFVSSVGVEDDAVSVDAKWDDKGLKMEIAFKDAALKEAIGDEDATMKSFVEAMEESGLTCK